MSLASTPLPTSPSMAPLTSDENFSNLNLSTTNEVYCSVCSEKITQQHQQIHYGALACFSCRAFFRRAQRLKRPFAICKMNNSCKITVENRRFCGNCRFAACLRAGMNPKSVLNEEEKKHRFRRMLKRKMESNITNRKGSPEKQRKLDSEVGFVQKFFIDLFRDHNQRFVLNATVFRVLMALIRGLAEDFCSTLEDLKSVGSVQKQVILIRNQYLFATVILCRFFSAKTAAEQYNIIFPDNQGIEKISSKAKLLTLDTVLKQNHHITGTKKGLLLLHFQKKLSSAISLIQNETSLRLSAIQRALLLHGFNKGVLTNNLNDIEKILFRRLIDISDFAKIMEVVYSSPVNRSEIIDSPWRLVQTYSDNFARQVFDTFNLEMESFENFCQASTKFLNASVMVKLDQAMSLSEQLLVLGVNLEHQGLDYGHKISIFQSTSNKHLMQRALLDFENLKAKLAICFEHDEVFTFLQIISIFWHESESTFAKAKLLRAFAEFCESTPGLGHDLFNRAMACLEEQEKIGHYCLTFASHEMRNWSNKQQFVHNFFSLSNLILLAQGDFFKQFSNKKASAAKEWEVFSSSSNSIDKKYAGAEENKTLAKTIWLDSPGTGFLSLEIYGNKRRLWDFMVSPRMYDWNVTVAEFSAYTLTYCFSSFLPLSSPDLVFSDDDEASPDVESEEAPLSPPPLSLAICKRVDLIVCNPECFQGFHTVFPLFQDFSAVLG